MPSIWLGHVLVFGVLFALVIGWLFVQTRQAERIFLADAQARAQLLTEAVLLHTRSAVLAEQVTADILTRFLDNSARFVSYLDGIAPFRSDELTAFADEAGLSLIRLIRADGMVTGAPATPPPLPRDCHQLNQLVRLPHVHLIAFGIAATSASGCVWVGLDSRHTEELEAAISLPRAVSAVATLPGVVAIRLDGSPQSNALPPLSAAAAVPIATAATPPAQLTLQQLPNGRRVAHAVATIAGARLVLDLTAEPLDAMRARLWQQFFTFLVALSVAGSVGTWLLYRHQRAHAQQRLNYERRLSRQREEASLGRAAAVIAHEIRNPLNAMAMGLQRLQLEADNLAPDQRRLLEIVLDAVGRTNGIVTGLLAYARPLQPRRDVLALDALVTEQLSLYQQYLTDHAIQLHTDIAAPVTVRGDPALLRQVVDNLLRNAVEAPGVTLLTVRVAQCGRDHAELALTNDGFTLPATELPRLLEPWFTTKTTGTGLGLAISQRIIAAHGGQLTLTTPAAGQLRVVVRVPVGRG
nr:ATP-binding protein [Thiospirillum jenense]